MRSILVAVVALVVGGCAAADEPDLVLLVDDPVLHAAAAQAADDWMTMCPNVSIVFSDRPTGDKRDRRIIVEDPVVATADHNGVRIRVSPAMRESRNLRLALTHEIGHALGLGHDHGSPDGIMRGVVRLTPEDCP